MSKQTAVEWLENKLDIIFPLEFEWDKLNNIFQQAKEMEKDLYICNKCKSQINEKEIMQQVQDSKKTD